MNKYITLSLLSLAALAGHAQDFDTKPTLELGNKEQDVKFTIGARMMTDAAYYHSDFTPMHSGAALTDARIRTTGTSMPILALARASLTKRTSSCNMLSKTNTRVTMP